MSSGPGIEITGDTRVFWDEDTLSITGAFNPLHVRVNLTAALAKKNIHGFLELNYYCDKKTPIPDSSMQERARFHFYPDDEPDSVGKTLRSKIMLTRILLWAFDFNPANKEGPANLMIVSNSVPQDPEMIRVLQALKKRNFSILLVRSDKLDNVEYADTGDLLVENFDWLWGSLMFGDKPFIDPSETRAGSVFCSGCHVEVSITEDEGEDEDEDEDDQDEDEDEDQAVAKLTGVRAEDEKLTGDEAVAEVTEEQFQTMLDSRTFGADDKTVAKKKKKKKKKKKHSSKHMPETKHE